MARKPARLERSGALTPRDRMWAAIRSLATIRSGVPDSAAGFSVIEVAFLSGQLADTVLSYLRGLHAAGFLGLCDDDRPHGRKRRELTLYSLKRDIGVEAPRVTTDGKLVTQGAANEQMWVAMKALREFDCVELANAASTAAVPVPRATAQTYAKHLQRAGYLGLAVVGGPAKLARYRFNRAMNTGPRAPLVCKDKSVMDANTGKTAAVPARGGAA